MNSEQSRAFLALGLGPLWKARTTHSSAKAVLTDPSDAWQQLRDRVSACQACGLCQGRTQTVFGTGDLRASWLFVGEAPGAEEDKLGEPFVGRAGVLLDAMLGAVGLHRSQGVYIANVIKCRPPGNRNPTPEEVAQCEPYLHEQLALLQPRLIVLMGRFAAQSLLGSEASIASLRGRLHTVKSSGRSIPAVVTYHPAYLLRTPADKAKAWVDLCMARRHWSDQVDSGHGRAD
jgi:uracil-DNA glycosylase family 4